MEKSQAPSTKSQLSSNLQNPNPQRKEFDTFRSFEIGDWGLFGIWSLEFGISSAL
jgi:hypothetical protein